MARNIDELHGELKEKITRTRLKEISVEVIGRYRDKDFAALAGYARLLGIDPAGKNIGGLFAAIIQKYHPDKFAGLMDEIDARRRGSDMAALARIRDAYLFRKNVPSHTADFEETYEYRDGDFGYGDADDESAGYDDVMPGDEWAGDGDDYYEEREYGFVEAVSSLFFGNLEQSMEPRDLYNLDGELDLSGFEINDLSGAEHCVNITVLDLSSNNIFKIEPLSALTRLECLYLSENNIESIDCLAGLTRLRELDVSFNEIEDISVLLGMQNLVYVNIVGNPVRDAGVVGKLSKKGVIVIN